MKTQLHLNSNVPHGVGSGPESAAIDLIYFFLLSEFGQNVYRYITINQIGNDLQQFVMNEFLCKTHVNKKNNQLVAKIVVHPDIDMFKYYVCIEENQKLKFKALIYNGMPGAIYFAGLFFYGKWKGENEFIISGKEKEMAIHVLLNESKLEYINLTTYKKSPYFEMMRADFSKNERHAACEDWKHSLPPDVSAVLDFEPN